jgi:two-component sensor histidine kinase/CheY-like chemotaxis protein
MTPPKGRILIIDDDTASLKMLTDMLAERGYVVHPANEGELGLRFVQRTPPDLILLDIRMPGIDGYQLCASLRGDDATACIPVIFLSSMDRALDKVKAFRSGGVDYIVKPYESEEILARIETHLSLRRLRQGLESEVRERTAQLRASLEEKVALLKEVHHRVKNNLQFICSLLSLQADRIKDPSVVELFAESRNRVRSMALVHENLYRGASFARISMRPHIQSLCAHCARAYGMNDQRVELVTQIGDDSLDLDRALNCSLIINELVSNSLKHAFPGGRAGRVTVEFQFSGERLWILTVADNGVGLPPGLEVGQSDSLGLQLVHDLTLQLGGTIAVSSKEGTAFTITFDPNPGNEKIPKQAHD